jgi:hypothetical protein
MTGTNRSLRRVLLASTAVATLGLGSVASAQSIIDQDGVITINAGLDAFVAATSQFGTNLQIGSAVTGETSINVSDDTSIDAPQTIFGTTVEALTRLNQSTNTLEVSVPATGAGFTGSTALDLTADIEINAGTGALVRQVIESDENVTAAVDGAGGVIEIIVDTADVTAPLTASSNAVVADALANDSVNDIRALGAGGAPLQDAVSIASLQTVEPDGAMQVTATVDAGVVQIDTSATTGSVTDLVSLDVNSIGARAGANIAINEITAGNGNGGYVIGSTGPADLEPANLDTADEIAAFIADIGIASLQNIDPGLTVDATVTAADILATFSADDEVSGDVSMVGNQVLAAAQGNVVTNRALATVGGIDGVSLGVASLQDAEGLTINSLITDAGMVVSGGEFAADTNIDISGNRVDASTTANEALNVISLSSPGILGGSEATAVGRQIANEVDASATVAVATLRADINDAAGPSGIVTMNDNTIIASAALNSLENVVFGNGTSQLSPSTMIASARQEITLGSVNSATTGDIQLVSGAGADVSGTMTNNRIAAVSTGNVASNTIVNRTQRFSFSR